jgi:predicted SprT family Zn-dependent metalloprotease
MANSELAALAESILNELMSRQPLRQRPDIVWKPLRVTAGVAYYRINRIGLSKNLLTDPERLRITLVHEYAHLLAVQRHGVKAAGHGPAWKQAMSDLDAKAERTHCYEVQRNAVRQQVTYLCQRCGTKIVRARRLPRRRKYVHASCGGGLRLISIEKTTNMQAVP